MSHSQFAGCNRFHENQERLSRWLLMARDQTQSGALDFTQGFLGMMLGARRTTVSVIAGVSQRSGLIRQLRVNVHPQVQVISSEQSVRWSKNGPLKAGKRAMVLHLAL